MLLGEVGWVDEKVSATRCVGVFWGASLSRDVLDNGF